MLTTKQRILRILDACSIGARKGTGFFLGADRLTAARVYAGVEWFPASTGTAPNAQRRRVCGRFRELAARAGVTPRQVKDVLRIVFQAQPERGLRREVKYGMHGM